MKTTLALLIAGLALAGSLAAAATITLSSTQAGKWTYADPMELIDPAQPGLGYKGGAWNPTNVQTPDMTDLWVGWTDGCRHVSLIDFNALPGNLGTINSATLHLFTTYQHTGVPLTVMTNSAVGTWNATTPIANIPVAGVAGGSTWINSTTMGDVAFDVKAVVNNWATQGNTTIRMGDAAGSGWQQFRAFTATGANAPYIVLDYTPVPEPAAISLAVLGGLGLLRRRRN